MNLLSTIWLMLISGVLIFILTMTININKTCSKTEIHYLLPDSAKCRIKLMYFRDAKGDKLPPVSVMSYEPTPDALCWWEMR